MREVDGCLRLALLVALLSLVIGQPNPLTITAASCGLPALAWGVRRRQSWYWLLPLCCCYACYFALHQQALTKDSRLPVQVNGRWTLLVQPADWHLTDDGRLTGRGRLANGQSVNYYYQLDQPQALAAFRKARAPLLLQVQGDYQPIEAPSNFYQFDYRGYARCQGLTHQLVIHQIRQQGLARPKGPWQAVYFRLRTSQAQALAAAATLPQPLSVYAQTVLLGGREPALYRNHPGLQELGLVHLFSMSGFHVAFLLAFCQKLGRWLRIERAWLAGMLLVLLPLFYCFTGMAAVLIRAVIAGEARLIKRHWGLQWSAQSIWGLSLLLTLLLQPMILLTLGGQLSFSLTLALIVTKRYRYWQRTFFLSVITFPLLTAQHYTWNCWQTLANGLAIPLFTYLVLPAVLLGYLGCFLPVLVQLANGLVATFDQTVAWLASWPGQIVLGALPWGCWCLLFLLPWFWVGQGRIRQLWLFTLWCGALGLGYYQVHWPSQGEYTTFDIGQGDAALLREPYNRTVTLIDTGGKVSFGRPGFAKAVPVGRAEQVILPYLHAKGIAKVDALSLSHQDQDHIGDAGFLLQHVKVDRLLVPAGLPAQPAFAKKVRPYLGRTKVLELTDQVALPGLPLKVLYPFAPGQGENEDSLSFAVQAGQATIFTAGDLDQQGEAAILAKYPTFRPDIIKFGHHGSKTATNPAVMAAWRPHYGLISAGRRNRYGHPHAATLATAAKEGMVVYSTQQQGMLRYVYKDGEKGRFQVCWNHEIS
ncbi:DNA internalization-related competence protein ComEC/Rec2 [Leuconostocaceae bacterium ESL0958]|nr:DNA internalization-related competence protein ComEC/Rec2 [Leuconostocaceae bacterium ESL0958]